MVILKHHKGFSLALQRGLDLTLYPTPGHTELPTQVIRCSRFRGVRGGDGGGKKYTRREEEGAERVFTSG